MTDQALDTPRREPAILRFLKNMALMRESVVGMIGFALVLFWVLVAIFAEVNLFGIVKFGLSPFPPNGNLVPMIGPFTDMYLDGNQKFLNLPAKEICVAAQDGKFFCGTSWLGTDHLGRDILSRIIYGSRRVLYVAPLATFCAYAVGIPMGLAAGYLRGITDDVLSFIANVILSFPVLVLYVVIIATFAGSSLDVPIVIPSFVLFGDVAFPGVDLSISLGTGTVRVVIIIVAVTFASAPGIFRIVRGLTLDLRTREYVFASETRGETRLYIMLVEILPNARGPLIVDVCLRIGYVVITIGVLGFLGLGLPPPDPDWGGMINETRSMAMIFPWMAVFPCIAISSLVLGFNLLADGLREVSLRD